MCGIAGIIRLSDATLPAPEVVHRMAAAIAHRGPDGYGDLRDEYVHIAAVRLSILDLDGGIQPAFDEDRVRAAVYNGELYNFKELSKGLTERGHRILSTGDTAVLPHLYEELGPQFVEKLRGMFAFAIWDKGERCALICRDRLGIKPLYYATTNKYLLFASEIKGIIASRLVNPEIDKNSLDDLFSISYPFPPRTMFKDIQELLPAHRMIVRPCALNPIQIERYWRAPFSSEKRRKNYSESDLIDEFKERLKSTVKDHLISDVKVGTYLSGGVDSSIVTSFASKSSELPLDAFTISFPDSLLDEGIDAHSLARRIGVNHHMVNISDETASSFLKSVYHTELPLQYPLASSFIRMSQVVKESGVKVILTGEGADELLAGYDCFRLERIRRWLDRPVLRRLKGRVYTKLFNWLGSADGLAEFFETLHRNQPAAKVKASFGGVKPPWFDIWNALEPERIALLSVDNRVPRPTEIPPNGFLNALRPDIGELSELDAALAVELETRLPSWTVLIDDRASMANGVETRVPFLDHELVEWMVKLPPELKLKRLRDKYILRRAAKGILPDRVCERAKRPFYSPIKELFFDKSRPEFVSELLSSKLLKESNLFSVETVNSLSARLDRVKNNTFEKHRLEWLLILVLGSQALWSEFIKEGARLANSEENINSMLSKRMSAPYLNTK